MLNKEEEVNKTTEAEAKEKREAKEAEERARIAKEKEGNMSSVWFRYIGATVAIVAMWLAVLLVGIYASNFVNDGTTVNTSIMVAPFAMGGTIVVAMHGYRP